jgi:RHS repeat-associated protein
LLTSYNGQEIVYDEQGNPTQYLGHNLTWEKGRQLKSFEKVVDGGTKKVISYTYNANGIRTSKTVDNIRHDFVLDGAKILRETWEVDDVVNSIVPLYDNEDSVCGIEYNGAAYYFLKNLQGDVIAITDSSGEEVARYSYDAWGALLSVKDADDTDITDKSHIANINPFRYRSYYFDLESGLYYLQSRYYDAKVGRFVNGDMVEFATIRQSILEHNLYVYCGNQIINCDDKDGRDAVWLQATEKVLGLGHTGLVFKYGEKWYYWYWGFEEKIGVAGYLASLALALIRARFWLKTIRRTSPYPIKYVCALIGIAYRVASTTVRAKCKLTEVSSKSSLTESEALNEGNKKYSNGFDDSLYIKGDFNMSYYYFKVLTITKNYNLLFRNCMQTTVDGLLLGSFSKNKVITRTRLYFARNMIIPNVAFNYIDKYL